MNLLPEKMSTPWVFAWEYAVPVVFDANKFKVGIVNIRTGVSVDDYEKAGKLFAAAPEMLEALQMLVELDNCNDGRDRLAAFDAKYGVKPGDGRYNLIYTKVRDAVAKATGE